MRVRSRNGYLPCPNLGRPFDGTIFICEVCGAATNMHDHAFERLLVKRAESLGFAVRDKMIEVQGICRRCAGPHQ